MVSTRTDLFSKEYIDVLKTLQDEVPAFSGAKARAIVAQARPLPPLPAWCLLPKKGEQDCTCQSPRRGGGATFACRLQISSMINGCQRDNRQMICIATRHLPTQADVTCGVVVLVVFLPPFTSFNFTSAALIFI